MAFEVAVPYGDLFGMDAIIILCGLIGRFVDYT
jgi:hypothetical protein